MARFSGVIGFGESVLDTNTGVSEDVITERHYYGNIVQDILKVQEANEIHNGLRFQNLISIVADAYVREHITAMRYIKWQGVLWVISSFDVQHPRLILRLGGEYNGPTPATP